MRKHVIHLIDIIILILCFLFIISTFFKIVSCTILGNIICDNITVLIMVWIIGMALSVIFTRPLYQWILHLRRL